MFEFVNNRQVLYGKGKLAEIPALMEWHGCKKVFFVVYSRQAKEYGTLVSTLRERGIDSVCYDKVQGEPDLHTINGGRDLFVQEGCDCTLALGGGSVIDAAKAINMLAANGGMVEQYQMEGKAVTCPSSLFVAAPTTSGTGAEATKTSVVTNNYNGLKKSLYHTSMIADIVVLDPEITVSLPAAITAATGMDALSHAVESYVSLNANPFSEMFGLQSMALVNQNLAAAVREPGNLEARGGMMLGSYLGGCAITAGIGIAHIMAQPVGALYKIPHGDACSIFLPAAMERNLPYATTKYAAIAGALGVADAALSDEENGRRAIRRVEELRAEIGAPASLRPYLRDGEPDLGHIVDVVKRTTGHIGCNPRPLDEELMRDMFSACL